VPFRRLRILFKLLLFPVWAPSVAILNEASANASSRKNRARALDLDIPTASS